MRYKLDESVVRENLLSKLFPEQRNIVTVGNCLVGYNHPKVKKGKEDLGPNCIFIQKGSKFLAPSYVPIYKEKYYDPGLIAWAIELMGYRSGQKTSKTYREGQYLFIESMVPYERVPIWDWKLGRVSAVYMDYMNKNLERFDWKNSTFHEKLKIDNSMSGYTDNAKYNIDLFGFTINAIAEASNFTKLYRKRGNISMAGYFKNEIVRDIFFKIIQGIYYDYCPVYQSDLYGNNMICDWEYKVCRFSDIMEQTPVIKGGNFFDYKKRITKEYAHKLYNWYFPHKRDGDSQMSIYRIQEGIDLSKELRNLNKTSVEMFGEDYKSKYDAN